MNSADGPDQRASGRFRWSCGKYVGPV